jgi:hypothetical protein
MRRGLEIRLAFVPTRLSAEHLRAVYEMVTPVVDREIIRCSDVDEEHGLGAVIPQRKGGTR